MMAGFLAQSMFFAYIQRSAADRADRYRGLRTHELLAARRGRISDHALVPGERLRARRLGVLDEIV